MFIGKVYAFCAMFALVGAQPDTKQQCNNVNSNQTNMCCVDRTGPIPGGALDDIKSQFAVLQAKIQTLESQGKSQVAQIRALETKVAAQEALSMVQRRAFHAHGSSRDISYNSVIKFGTVVMNQNGNYNPAASVFTCDDSGLYIFYVTIVAYGAQGYGSVWYQIVQDGIVKAAGFTGGGPGPSGTHFAMVTCSSGSKIWVKQGHFRSPLKQGMWGGHSQFGAFEIDV